MLVETWMSEPVITVGANDPMQRATQLSYIPWIGNNSFRI
ncbi:hypothetical protein D1AOALGA4SA_12170 [Olavius algarvensis Delta 1 endosymbiont]|nr:hypothetical protein D1AOALGA4SA_12170 [Olavius algarvensis Delta 1 endosymbiont]